MKVKTFAVDLANRVFQVHGFDVGGRRVLKRRLKREEFLGFFEQREERCVVVMEACRGAHHWGRQLRALGYEAELIAPQHVKALVVGSKTDANDADAIYEASLRPRIGRVALKSLEQQEVQALHRVRERLIKERTARVNQIRGLLSEVGLVLPARRTALYRALPEVLEEADNGLSPRLRALVGQLWEELGEGDARIARLECELRRELRANEVAQRLDEVPGVGALTATALVASVGGAGQFSSARQFAAWLGLVPKEHSSGERRRLGGITKRGDVYLRKLLIHGARSAVRAAARKQDRHSRWIQALVARRGHNRAVVAVANKSARVLWALLRSGERYRAPAY